jgi:hypothetical protein
VWRHPAEGALAARTAFPRTAARAVRGEEEKGRKEEKERDEVAA